MNVKGFVRWAIILVVALFPAQAEVKADGPPYLVSITVTPEFPTILVGQSETFTATGYDQNGDHLPPNDPQWSCDGQHGAIAVDPEDPTKCNYTATSVGSGWIQVFGGGTQIHGSTDIAIQGGGELARIEVTPGEVTLRRGDAQQFTAKGFDARNNEIPIDPIWTTSGGTINSDGLYTSTTTGDFTVTASVEGSSVTGTATAHVTGLARIEVTPGEVTLRVGDSQQFTAKGFDADDNGVPIEPIWSTTSGTIDQDGLYTSTTTGDFTVTASAEGSSVTGTATVHVTHGELARIEVTPGEVTLRVGDSQQFTAKGFDADDNGVPIEPVWTASGGQIDQAGKYTCGSLPGRNLVNAVVGQMKGLAWIHVAGPASCPELEPGQSWEHTFSIAGVYPYYDQHNPDLKGFVVVVAPALPSAPSVPTIVGVCVSADGFVPLAVTIGLGDTVRWTNADIATHSVNGGLYYEK